MNSQALGAVLRGHCTVASSPVDGGRTGPGSPFASYALDDVHLGGAIMWVGGDGLMMVMMVVLGRVWVRDPSGRIDFGPWLESARRSAFFEQVGDDSGSGDLDAEVDDALAAYNRMLSRLDRGGPWHTAGGGPWH